MAVEIDSAQRRSVLIVDDDRAVSRLIRRNLEDQGIQILEAPSGLDCVKILHDSSVDLIVLDVRLPDFNGWGILSLLRLTEPLRHIPVIVISVDPPNSALVAQLHPDDYIQKPFDMRELLIRVNKFIGLRSTNQAS